MIRAEVGVGMRPPHYPQFLRGEVAPVSWVEVNAEKYLPDADGKDEAHLHLQVLRHVRERMPVVLHGTSMSLGSADGYDRGYVERLAELADLIEPAAVSDHLCWTGVDGAKLPDLLPMPLTEDSIAVLVPHILEVQDRLKRPLLVENLSTYLQSPHDEMPEWEFVAEIARRTDCYLLLDINNVFVASSNHGWDMHEYLRNVPHSRVGQIHLAGHTVRGELRVDTHGEPVCEEVWQLFEWYVTQFGWVPTMIERDTNVPPWAELAAELTRIKQAAERTRSAEAQCA